MKICPQLKGMVEKSSVKMKENQVVDVYKITTKLEGHKHGKVCRSETFIVFLESIL
jgi:hypothetical protein